MTKVLGKENPIIVMKCDFDALLTAYQHYFRIIPLNEYHRMIFIEIYTFSCLFYGKF